MIGAVIDLDRTREDCAARDARVDAMFDSLDDDFDRIFERIPAAGRRDPQQRTRAGDPRSQETSAFAETRARQEFRT